MALTPQQEQILREVQAKLREEEIAQMPKGLPGMEVIEPALAIGAATAGQVAGGIIGGGEGFLRGLYEGDPDVGLRTAVKRIEQIGDFVGYEPRTQYGARGMQALQEAVEPVFGPIGEQIQKQEKLFSGAAFEATGSPWAAGLAAAIPQVALEAAAILLLRGARPQKAFFDVEGRPTQELMEALNAQGLSFDDLVLEAVRELPDQTRRQLLTGAPDMPKTMEPVQRAQIEGGGRESALAPLMVEGSRVKSDPLAEQAIQAWQRPGVIQSAKQANPATQAKMLRMLDMRRRIGQNEALAARMRPTDITGESLMGRVDYLQDVLNVNTRRLRDIEQKNLPGKPVRTEPVLQAYQDALDQLDVQLTADNKLVFKGSQIAANPGAQRTIQSLHALLKEDVPIDALRFHKLKRQLDELIDYGKTKQELTPTPKNVLNRVRTALNDEIRRVDRDYAQVNDVISDLLGSFDRLQGVAGKRTDLSQPGAATRLGQEARKIFSNYNVRGELIEAIDEIDQAALRYGGEFDDSVMDLAMFATALDQRFGPVAKTSLEGALDATNRRQELQENVLSAVLDTSTAGATTGTMAGVGRRLAKMVQARELTDEDAYRLMEQLLRRGR